MFLKYILTFVKLIFKYKIFNISIAFYILKSKMIYI